MKHLQNNPVATSMQRAGAARMTMGSADSFTAANIAGDQRRQCTATAQIPIAMQPWEATTEQRMGSDKPAGARTRAGCLLTLSDAPPLRGT